MWVLLRTGYNLWCNRPMPEQRLSGDQWKGSTRWWRMTAGITDGILYDLYDPV